MSKDLYDLAKPVRDAALAEVKRSCAQGGVSDDVLAANELGVHLAAALMAFVADRCKTLEGRVKDCSLQGILASGVAVMVGNMAVNFRPIIGEKVVPPEVNIHLVLQAIAAEAFRQVAHAQAGLQDFNVQFESRLDGGELSPKTFDFAKMMKGQS